ncbi:MAG: peptidase [Halocynthiibacter sp.]
MSVVTSKRVVAATRGWIGTPYQHQASLKGVGTDCLGLLRGVWRELYGDEPERVPAYTQDWSEPSKEERLLAAAARNLRPRKEGVRYVGDVLIFRMRTGSVAKHLGIQSELGDVPKFIHAYSGHGVVENTFSEAWQSKLVARFYFPRKV